MSEAGKDVFRGEEGAEKLHFFHLHIHFLFSLIISVGTCLVSCGARKSTVSDQKSNVSELQNSDDDDDEESESDFEFSQKPQDLYEAIMSTPYLELLVSYPDIDSDEYKELVLKQIDEDFRVLSRHVPTDRPRNGQLENLIACRYDNIPIYDHNRVIVPFGEGDEHSDFYPAAVIDCPKDPNDESDDDDDDDEKNQKTLEKKKRRVKRFIAAENPGDDNVEEFWKMVWIYEVTDVVWLGNYEEFSRNEGGVTVSRCSDYFPTPDPEDHDHENERPMVEIGDLEVTGVSRHTKEDVVWRQFEMKNVKDGTTRPLRHRQHKYWYPFGCPRDFWNCTLGLIGTDRDGDPYLNDGTEPNDAVVLVHCSNGIGRTGTAIAIDFVMARLKITPDAFIPFIIRDELRELRPYAVQTSVQLLFIIISVYKRAYAGKRSSEGFDDPDHSRMLYAAYDALLAREEPKLRLVWE